MGNEELAEVRRAIEAGFKELRESVDRLTDAIDELPDAGNVVAKLEEIRQALPSAGTRLVIEVLSPLRRGQS